MKKLVVFISMILVSCGVFAEDLVPKRQNIATSAVAAATQLRDAIETLKRLKEERSSAGNFADSDFVGTDLKHLTAFDIGALLDTVVPAFDATLQDAGNGNFNKNILLKVRK